MYDTYVGTLAFQPEDDKDLLEVQRVGNEFGATTGRMRKCNWLDIPRLRKSMEINGVTHLVLNKFDIFREIGIWKVRLENDVVAEFDTETDFVNFLFRELPSDLAIYHSDNPETL